MSRRVCFGAFVVLARQPSNGSLPPALIGCTAFVRSALGAAVDAATGEDLCMIELDTGERMWASESMLDVQARH